MSSWGGLLPARWRGQVKAWLSGPSNMWPSSSKLSFSHLKIMALAPRPALWSLLGALCLPSALSSVRCAWAVQDQFFPGPLSLGKEKPACLRKLLPYLVLTWNLCRTDSITNLILMAAMRFNTWSIQKKLNCSNWLNFLGPAFCWGVVLLSDWVWQCGLGRSGTTASLQAASR